MFRSTSHFKRGLHAIAGAFFLALLIAGGLGITRVHAMEAAAAAAMPATHGVSSLCAAELRSSEDYLHEEEAVLRKVTQSNWEPAEMASPSSSNFCAAGLRSNEDSLRQEEAVLRIVTQGSWSAAQLATLDGAFSPAAGMHSKDYYLLQEEAVLRIVTRSSWDASEIASFGGFNFIAHASR